MKISEVSKAAELPVSTIRYYEKMGIIPDEYMLRDPNNYRVYDDNIVNYLEVVKTSVDLGFSIGEIRGMIDGVGCSLEEQTRLLQEKIDEIETAQQKLDKAKTYLSDLISSGTVCEEGFGKSS
ncbi:MerR family transcriptional regulator [Saccharibacillus sacchari]|uniref:MerR family transcriptional regulator n=1 Tax=Saccharibacillus sacchari TaxID=456493 RepID=A0ACC6PA82_9BACL